jgi:hypothetical protein
MKNLEQRFKGLRTGSMVLLALAMCGVTMAQMPTVDASLIPPPNKNPAQARPGPLIWTPGFSGIFALGGPHDIGSFRTPCFPSHVAFDDPIVFPRQPGRSHLHTFFGNTRVDANSTPASIQTTGHSTCAGGTLNRSSYWVPSVIDTRTGAPAMPEESIFYYKGGYLGVPQASIKPFPRGFRMIAGDPMRTASAAANVRFTCHKTGATYTSLSEMRCAAGDDVIISVIFPQCSDGVNLDSPDHKSHVAYATWPHGCPASHPVGHPEITFQIHYRVTEAGQIAHWRLSSDNYRGPSGYSMHGDWFEGWDPDIQRTFVERCINARMDCHAFLLGDGRALM